MTDTIAEDIGNLFNNQLFSDLTLIVNGQRFFVHKNILAIRNDYFRTLLTTDLRESNQKEIITHQSNAQLFEKVLRFIYSGETDMTNTSEEEVIQMLYMANKYLVFPLQRSVEDQLRKILSITNYCSIYSAAFACSATELKTYCFQWYNYLPLTHMILLLDGFSTLHHEAISELINSEAFSVPHEAVFDAISQWIEENGGKETEGSALLLSKIHLTQMPLDFLTTKVRRSGLYSETRILDAITAMCSRTDTSESDSTTSFSVNVREYGPNAEVRNVSGLYPYDTGARLHDAIRLRYGFKIDIGLCVLFSGFCVEYHRTLASYGIGPNAELTFV